MEGAQENTTLAYGTGVNFLSSESLQKVTPKPSFSDIDANVYDDDSTRRAIATMNSYAIPSLYFILFVLGVIGNSVVVYVSCFMTKTTKNAVDIFVGNLALADLAVIATLPFWAVTHILGGAWMFGDVGCKIISFLTNLNMYSSIFLITAMAVDRYIVVVKAVKVRAKSLRSVRRTLVSCAVIWTLALIFALPSAILRQTMTMGSKTVCSWVYPKATSDLWWGLHIVSRNVFGFFIPLAVICRCYCVIIGYVRGRSSSITLPSSRSYDSGKKDARERQQQHVTRLVTAIILAFVVCWLPNQLSNFSHSLVHFKALPEPSKKGAEVMYLVHLITTVLSFCNSVINPVIYSTSPSHRVHIKMLLLRIFKRDGVGRDGSYNTYLTNNKDPFGCVLNCRPPTKPQDRDDNKKNRRPTDFSRLSVKDDQRKISSNTSTTVTILPSPAVPCRMLGSDDRLGYSDAEDDLAGERVAVRLLPTGVEPPEIVIDDCSSVGNRDPLPPSSGYQRSARVAWRSTSGRNETSFEHCDDDCRDPLCDSYNTERL